MGDEYCMFAFIKLLPSEMLIAPARSLWHSAGIVTCVLMVARFC